ncbi:hypothetical protein AURDEDRAFT_171801 [Auricularia subglabra TFB-10046 SS5]|nr:hypothetical protein AURDEDRAFT_171801 [Auricularia subglabra TFB-10046 SS5]
MVTIWEVTKGVSEFLGITSSRDGDRGYIGSESAIDETSAMTSGRNAHLEAAQSARGPERSAPTPKAGALAGQQRSENSSAPSTRSSGLAPKACHACGGGTCTERVDETTGRPSARSKASQKPAPPPRRSQRDEKAFHDTRSPEEEYEDTLKRLHDLEKSAAERESELCRALDEATERETALRRALGDAERRLATATNDLANLRSLTVDEVDTEGFLKLFDDINDAVSDAAFRLINELDMSDGAVQLSHLQALKDVNEPLYSYLEAFLKSSAAAKLPVEQVLVPAVQGLVFWIIYCGIFRWFNPRAGKPENQLLRHIHDAVQARGAH